MTLRQSLTSPNVGKTPKTPRKPNNNRDTSIQSPYFSSGKAHLSTRLNDLERKTQPKNNHDTLPAYEPVVLAPDVQNLLDHLTSLKPDLIQEKVANDPWKLLIAVTLLNKTTGKLAIPVFWRLIERWPTPLLLSQVNPEELVDLIRPLGTQTIRTNRLIDLSKAYMQDPPSTHDIRASRTSVISTRSSRFFSLTRIRYPATPVSHLPGAGIYALDSYRIFCISYSDPFSEEWKFVQASDKELVRYLKWKWASFEHLQWSSNKGPGRPVTSKYLRLLIADLEVKS
ncbi:DNA glycosylase [Crepidotus variabilis]|uniref:DNA glycosylase n=1 Tax=Crepidotus variabilis TaxID=179855 RepID=A0A9P6ENG4_9AGAR|nr:DNA glycosylase [Crepidotus variabilis]